MSTPGHGAEEESFESTAERDLDEVEASLAAIERALEGFDDGSYGKCEVCGEPIEPERLTTQASSRRCAVHAGS